VVSSMPATALLSDTVRSLCVPRGTTIVAAGITVPIQAALPSTAAAVRPGVARAENAARQRSWKEFGRRRFTGFGHLTGLTHVIGVEERPTSPSFEATIARRSRQRYRGRWRSAAWCDRAVAYSTIRRHRAARQARR